MSLLEHKDKNEKTTGKKLLTRGPKIAVNSHVTRTDIEDSTKEKNSLKNDTKSTIVHKTFAGVVTEPVNIRVDNHIRNKVAALITMGHSDSQKEMVDSMIDRYLEDMDKSDLKRFNELVDIYEDKDFIKHQKKLKK